jgi:hypothetical protein
MVIIGDITNVLVDVCVFLERIIVSEQSTIQSNWLIQLNLTNKSGFFVRILVKIF